MRKTVLLICGMIAMSFGVETHAQPYITEREFVWDGYRFHLAK